MSKILVCNPEYYGIEYEINPWMSVLNQADRGLAVQQWYGLVDLLKRIGVEVVEMAGQPGLPDMVFTANAGLVFSGKRVVLSRFKHPQRQPERECFREWFDNNNFDIHNTFGDDHFFEGAGDALFRLQSPEENHTNSLYFGYGFRSNYEGVTSPMWGRLWGQTIHWLQLRDAYFYHLDTCFCPLKDDFALIWPGAFDNDISDRLGLELLRVPEEDARKFACNAVAVGNKVVIPAGCEATKRLLAGAGFEVYDTDMSEFIKAGGACKCLTLRLE